MLSQPSQLSLFLAFDTLPLPHCRNCQIIHMMAKHTQAFICCCCFRIFELGRCCGFRNEFCCFWRFCMGDKCRWLVRPSRRGSQSDRRYCKEEDCSNDLLSSFAFLASNFVITRPKTARNHGECSALLLQVALNLKVLVRGRRSR